MIINSWKFCNNIPPRLSIYFSFVALMSTILQNMIVASLCTILHTTYSSSSLIVQSCIQRIPVTLICPVSETDTQVHTRQTRRRKNKYENTPSSLLAFRLYPWWIFLLSQVIPILDPLLRSWSATVSRWLDTECPPGSHGLEGQAPWTRDQAPWPKKARRWREPVIKVSEEVNTPLKDPHEGKNIWFILHRMINSS